MNFKNSTTTTAYQYSDFYKFTPTKRTEKVMRVFSKHWFVFMITEDGILNVSKTIGDRKITAMLKEKNNSIGLSLKENNKPTRYEIIDGCSPKWVEAAISSFLGGQHD